MKRHKRGQKGFSLIEILIAMTILGIILMSLIGIFIYGFNVLSRTKQVSLATQICQERVEVVRNMPFASITALGSTFTDAKMSYLPSSAGTQTIEAGPGADIKKLTITVSWIFRGVNVTRDVVTFIARDGINKE